MSDKYTYRVEWSSEDEVFVGRCLEFPSVAAHGKSHEAALQEVRSVVSIVIKDLKENKEPVPPPFSEQKFQGKFPLRMPPELHRELALEAVEQSVSLNQLIVSRLRRPDTSRPRKRQNG